MPFNGFEQLEWIVPEPRQAFEDVTAEILISSGRALRRIRVNRGDGGVDVYYGHFRRGGRCRRLPGKVFSKTALGLALKNTTSAILTKRHADAQTLIYRSWHLCVPSRPTKEDVRWFDEWARSLDVPATLIDGDDLVRLLNQPSSGQARKMLRDWGVIGIENDSAILEAAIQIDVD